MRASAARSPPARLIHWRAAAAAQEDEAQHPGTITVVWPVGDDAKDFACLLTERGIVVGGGSVHPSKYWLFPEHASSAITDTGLDGIRVLAEVATGNTVAPEQYEEAREVLAPVLQRFIDIEFPTIRGAGRGAGAAALCVSICADGCRPLPHGSSSRRPPDSRPALPSAPSPPTPPRSQRWRQGTRQGAARGDGRGGVQRAHDGAGCARCCASRLQRPAALPPLCARAGPPPA
jgi:hypothetical protein